MTGKSEGRNGERWERRKKRRGFFEKKKREGENENENENEEKKKRARAKKNCGGFSRSLVLVFFLSFPVLPRAALSSECRIPLRDSQVHARDRLLPSHEEKRGARPRLTRKKEARRSSIVV